jgi:hypothetical protein
MSAALAERLRPVQEQDWLAGLECVLVPTERAKGLGGIFLLRGLGDETPQRSLLRQKLDAVVEESGCSLKDLTVLASQNDPFRIDTPARHRDGEWLAVAGQRRREASRTSVTPERHAGPVRFPA